MHRLTRIALACSTILLVAACAKKEEAAQDTTAAMAPAPAPAPAPTIALADVAGKWQFNSVPMTGTDTSPTKYVLTATADSAGWTLTFPDKQVVPLQATVSGDSVMLASGEFTSQRRKSTKVKTATTLRLVDGKLQGVTTAHYAKAGADSVLQLKSEGTRIP
jgi:glucose/arabinose dehydrogenase